MIKIQTRRPISLIAQEHLNMAKDQSKGDVYGKLKKKIEQGMPSDELAFLKFLESKLDTILIGDPYELNSLIDESQAYLACKTKSTVVVQSSVCAMGPSEPGGRIFCRCRHD